MLKKQYSLQKLPLTNLTSNHNYFQLRCQILWSKREPLPQGRRHGKKNTDEMLFWTKEEFASFVEVIRDRPASYAIFMTLYYTGMREVELLALTLADVDINKSYQRLDGRRD